MSEEVGYITNQSNPLRRTDPGRSIRYHADTAQPGTHPADQDLARLQQCAASVKGGRSEAYLPRSSIQVRQVNGPNLTGYDSRSPIRKDPRGEWRHGALYSRRRESIDIHPTLASYQAFEFLGLPG